MFVFTLISFGGESNHMVKSVAIGNIGWYIMDHCKIGTGGLN